MLELKGYPRSNDPTPTASASSISGRDERKKKMKSEICRLAYLAAFATLLSTARLWSQSAIDPVENAFIRSEPTPGVRFMSGLMICDEELYNGRWVNRYWTSTGQIKPEVHLEGQSQRRAGLTD